MSKDSENTEKDYINFLTKEKYYMDYILDNSRSMISVINRDYIYEKVNAAFCKAQNTAIESVVGRSLGDVWGKEIFADKIKENIDKCFSGSTIRYEASFMTPQSGKRYFEVIFRPLPAGDGKITHIIAETFDITYLKITEKKATDSEEEFRRFETNLPIGFLRCDPSGNILHANRSFLNIIDCSAEDDLYMRNLKDYYSVEGIFRMHLEILKDKKTGMFGRVSLKNCKGKDIVCRVSAFLTTNDSGEPLFIDFSFEDSSRELMLENRLLQAQKLETIGALAGGIAHDFNNILTTISGYSEMLQNDLQGESASHQKVFKILQAVNKARSLTDQILTFSRHIEQEKVIVNVSDVLKETIDFMKHALDPGVMIKTYFSKKAYKVLADPTQLFRVFLNIITNAIQALEGKGGTVSIHLSVVRGTTIRKKLNKIIVADEYVAVKISDTGKGMDPSVLGRIFEPFFTTKEVGKGTGLGLSVVHGIISELSGEILVTSVKNKGSVFRILLPVSGSTDEIIRQIPGKRRILLLGSNKHESKILSMALESAGYEIDVFTDVGQFEEFLHGKQQEQDILILMTGREDKDPEIYLNLLSCNVLNIPSILITDPDNDFLYEKLLNSGFIKQHLINPVSLKEINNAISLSIKNTTS